MKKLLLVAALFCASVFAFGEEKKEPSNIATVVSTEVASDSVATERNIHLDSFVVFYDIDHLSVLNTGKANVMILDEKGVIVFEGQDSVDMSVPYGRYYICSDRKIRSEYRGQ